MCLEDGMKNLHKAAPVCKQNGTATNKKGNPGEGFPSNAQKLLALAVRFKGLYQSSRDLVCATILYLMALDHRHYFTVLKQRHGRR